MTSNFVSEGTAVNQDEKTYWFKDQYGLKGEQVSRLHAISLVKGIVGRELRDFEWNMLVRNPQYGSISFTIVSMLVPDSMERNFFHRHTVK